MTTAPAGPPITRARTMVALTAAFDGVGLRIDEAGVTLAQLTEVSVTPYDNTVHVQLQGGELTAFHKLLTLFPNAVRADGPDPSVGRSWLRANATMRDGTRVRIVVPESTS